MSGVLEISGKRRKKIGQIMLRLPTSLYSSKVSVASLLISASGGHVQDQLSMQRHHRKTCLPRRRHLQRMNIKAKMTRELFNCYEDEKHEVKLMARSVVKLLVKVR